MSRTIYVFVFLFLLIEKIFCVEKLIQIDVEIVEINLDKSYEFGIKWVDFFRFEEGSIPGIFKLDDFVRLNKFYSEIKLLMNKGAAEIVSSPRLLTKNNSLATFKAGGEIPYQTTTSLGSTNTEFKTYGVELEIRPKITEEDYVEIKLKSEISTPDETVSVVVSGNTLPGLLSRSVTTELEVKSGTTITIAGLNQNKKETKKIGIPILSEIPVLGSLFSYNKIVNKKTSLIIFVTPKIL